MNRRINNTKSFFRRFIIFASWQLLISPLVLASTSGIKQSSIKIGSYLTPGLITEDGTGMFNHLNKAIFNEMQETFEFSTTSIKRLRKGIRSGDIDAYFPELWENLPAEKHQYIVSDPIFYKRVVLFTLKESGLTNISDFENEVLGVVQGFAYGTEIKSNPLINLTFQENDNINIKLLLNKRIDGVLGGYPGTILAIKTQDTDGKIHYDIDKPVAILESFYVCKNNAEGIALCNSINKAIQSLMQKGVLELNRNTGASRLNTSE